MTNRWDERFMNVAKEVSTWSKDPSIKVGAVIVDKNRRILSTGYNGLPRNMEDSEEILNDRKVKLEFILHAEENALLNLIRQGCSCFESTLYVYGLPPCGSCARLISQSGISCVTIPAYGNKLPDRWSESWKISKKIFAITGISIKEIDYAL